MSLIASMASLIYIIYRVTKIKTYFSLSQKSRIVLSKMSGRPPEVPQLPQKNQEN
jgi:hypothetical protein